MRRTRLGAQQAKDEHGAQRHGPERSLQGRKVRTFWLERQVPEDRSQRHLALFTFKVAESDSYFIRTNVFDVVRAEVQGAVRPGNAKHQGQQGQMRTKSLSVFDGGPPSAQDRNCQGLRLFVLWHVTLQGGHDAICPPLVEGAETAHIPSPMNDGPPVNTGGLCRHRNSAGKPQRLPSNPW